MTEPSPADCAAAIDILLHGMPDEQRSHAAGFLLEEVERLYGVAGVCRPRWVDALRTEQVRQRSR